MAANVSETVEVGYTRMYAGADGETHFEDVAPKMAPAAVVEGTPHVDVADPAGVSSLVFTRLEAGFTSDWHPAPCRQFVIILSGGMELTTSDGQTRRFDPGSVFLAEDTTGRGHQARAAGDSPCVCAQIPCA